jgi:hypothetical protein
MNRKNSLAILSIITLMCLLGCSKSNTKEFFFGTSDGPDPFVIGTTLSPLKMISTDTVALPKPKPLLTASQMPSRAKKANEILGLITENQQISHDNNTPQMTEITGSISQNNNVIDFQKFDAEMNTQYTDQEESGYLLPTLLGTNKTIDPTTREKLKKE